ncbi:MAG: hypothetical protein WBD59_03565 [Candidatus Sulfotelmatobacter sp.]
MFLAPLVLIAMALQQCASYTGPNDGALHVCGHAYKVDCSLAGSATTCIGSRAEPAESDHFEVHEIGGAVVFAKGLSGDQRFLDVGISGTGYPDHPQLLIAGATIKGTKSGQSSSFNQYFEATPLGLHRFAPALSCEKGNEAMLANPNLAPPSGLTPACEFQAASFPFIVELKFDFDQHRIVLAPEGTRFSLISSLSSLKATRDLRLRAYRDHNQGAEQFTIAMAPEQRIRVAGIWAPVEFRNGDNIGTVTYHDDDLWLQIKLKNRTAWIRSERSWRSIGLEPQNGRP